MRWYRYACIGLLGWSAMAWSLAPAASGRAVPAMEAAGVYGAACFQTVQGSPGCGMADCGDGYGVPPAFPGYTTIVQGRDARNELCPCNGIYKIIGNFNCKCYPG